MSTLKKAYSTDNYKLISAPCKPFRKYTLNKNAKNMSNNKLILAHKQKKEETRQCTYKVILRRFRESLLQWKSNKYYISVCVCLRACGYPSAWACSCVCMHLALFIQYAIRMRHNVTSLWPLVIHHIFRHYLIKDAIFGKKVIVHKMCVFIFSTTFF
jgi:hypothetical protein